MPHVWTLTLSVSYDPTSELETHSDLWASHISRFYSTSSTTTRPMIPEKSYLNTWIIHHVGSWSKCPNVCCCTSYFARRKHIWHSYLIYIQTWVKVHDSPTLRTPQIHGWTFTFFGGENHVHDGVESTNSKFLHLKAE